MSLESCAAPNKTRSLQLQRDLATVDTARCGAPSAWSASVPRPRNSSVKPIARAVRRV
jgi:hypothetical protein